MDVINLHDANSLIDEEVTLLSLYNKTGNIL
jgi:hypothetical protein